ncbi:MAG: PKD domain-containing protein [Acidobacteriota bacterium]
MKSAVRTLAVFVAAAILWLNTGATEAQSGCGLQGSPSTNSMPRFAGTLTSGNLSTGGSSNYLYVVTQWGFARSSLSNPDNPSDFSQVIIAEEPGSGNGGLIRLTCDCHQGATAFAAAEAPDGSARMISDFNAARQAGTLVTPAQAARSDGSGGVRFGNQVKLGLGSDGSFPLGAKIGAIYVASSGKYFGYVPTEQGVAVIDLTNTNGQLNKSAALTPVSIFNWSPGSPAKVAAFRVTVGGSDLYLLAGVVDQTIRIATINPSSGVPSESASAASAGFARSLAVATVNGRIFVFTAEGTSGLRTYEYVPSQFGGALTATSSSIAGNFDRVMVRGGQLPAIFAHNNLSSTQSAIEIYDTSWLTQGGTARRAFSLAQGGSGEPYFDNSFEAIVRTTGSQVRAYVYRLKSPGVANEEVLVTTHTVDISCISADLSAPPVAGANFTNLSAAQRSGAEASRNYYGDRWRVQDNSSTASALTQIEWDWNVLSSGSAPTFQADAALSGPLPNAALTDFNPAYFPCDPSGALAGDPRTGTNCHGSLGAVPSGATYRIGVQTRNANGPSPSPFISSGVTVLAPAADIAGLDRATTPFVLRVLRGGTVSAAPSQGNLDDATFFWTFSTPSGPLTGADITTTSPSISIPSAATGFRMHVTYRGGYVSPDVAGNISQVDLVPSFSLTPDPVVKNGTINLTNTMQIATVASLNSVDWAVTSSSATPSAYDGQLPSGFLSAGGTTSRTAPGSPGTYHLHLRYNYSVSGSVQTPFLLSRSFTVIDQILLSLNANPTTADAGQVITFTATGGLGSSVYGWNFGDNLFGGFTTGGSTNTHAYSTPGPFTATVCVTNVSPQPCATAPVTITGTAPPPPPPPPPPGGLAASLSCPSNAGVGASVSCTVSATGGSAYSYTWSWGDSFNSFSPGPATNSHAYSSGGTYSVTVVVTSGTQSTSAGATITVGGSGPPPANINASLNCPSQGQAGTPISCTVTASGGTTYSYGWHWGDTFGGFTSGPATHSHTYASAGGFNVTVQVTSGTASTSATANVNVLPSGPPAPAATYTVTGATQNQFNATWEAESGRPVAFAAGEPDTAATFSWAVSNGGPTLTGRNVSHAFSGTGTRTVTLTVTGGGTATSGVTSTQIRFSIAAPRFQALMIPGAGHIDPVAPATDGTWATDLSVTNPGTSPMTLTLYFEPFGTTFPADLSQIPLDTVNNVSLLAGQSYSVTDVVSRLSPPKTGRGILLLKFDGGNADPIATATVYYTAQGRSYGSSLPTFRVGPFGTTTLSADTAGEQTLVGLRNDTSYRFNVSLFNASGQAGSFRLTAFGEDGVQVPLLDEAGAPTLSREFPIAPFQQALLQAAELGLSDATKRYVLKASPSGSTGALLAAASALDRRSNDLVQVSDDTPRMTAAADSVIEYYIPGVGRIGRDDVVDGPHWKTDLTLYSSSALPRDLTFEYRFTDSSGVEQRVLAPVTVLSGRSASLDDIVGTILDGYTPLDLRRENTLGLLRISYRAATDSTANPLLIGGRIYDDRGAAGTAGMQLFVYSNGESVAPGSPLVLPGAQQNLRFRTNIGFFSMGDLPTRVRVSGVKMDGTVAGSFEFLLNDASRSGHYVQLPMSAIPGIVGEPMTVKVEVLEGSRVGAYVVTVDQISSDTVFVQGRPTRLAN